MTAPRTRTAAPPGIGERVDRTATSAAIESFASGLRTRRSRTGTFLSVAARALRRRRRACERPGFIANEQTSFHVDAARRAAERLVGRLDLATDQRIMLGEPRVDGPKPPVSDELGVTLEPLENVRQDLESVGAVAS